MLILYYIILILYYIISYDRFGSIQVWSQPRPPTTAAAMPPKRRHASTDGATSEFALATIVVNMVVAILGDVQAQMLLAHTLDGIQLRRAGLGGGGGPGHDGPGPGGPPGGGGGGGGGGAADGPPKRKKRKESKKWVASLELAQAPFEVIDL